VSIASNGNRPYTADTRALVLSSEPQRALVPVRAVPSTPAAERATPPTLPSQLVAGRQSQPTWGGLFAHMGWRTIPRRSYERVDLTKLNIASMQVHQVMEILGDVSPEVSQALWNNLLMTNSGYELKVLDAAGNPDEQGQAMLDELVTRFNPHAGGLDGIIDQWHYTAYLQGAMAGEIVLSKGLKDVDDIFPISPWTIQFERDEPYPRPVQRLPWETKARELNTATFYYLPILPAVDDPYGRAPFSAVLSALQFDLQMLVDLRIAMHANAWDRLDITVLETAIVEAMPEKDRLNPVTRRAWVQSVMDEVRSSVSDMRADDTLIHTDATTIKPVQSGNRNVAAIQVFRMLERRIIRGLKQLPILMGSNEGTTETHGTIQFEIYIDGIRAVQDRTRRMLESMLTIAMQVRGRQSTVVMEWTDIRTVDRVRDAQAEAQEIENAAAKRDQGWINQDAASEAVTGSAAVADAPRAVTIDLTEDVEDDDAADETENDGDGRSRARATSTQRVTDESQTKAWQDAEASVLALLARYFREQRDAFPAEEVAEELDDLYGYEDPDVDVVVSDREVLPVVSAWFASVAALALAGGLTEDVNAAYVRAYNTAGTRALRQLGISGSFKLTNEEILTRIREKAVLRVTGFDEHSKRVLARIVARGIRDGLTVEELASRIKNVFTDMSDARALAIAQTEVTDLWAEVSQEVGRRNGLDNHTWHTELDDVTCEECAPNDGVTVAIGAQFPSGHSAPAVHPRCRCWLELEVPADWVAPNEPWRGA